VRGEHLSFEIDGDYRRNALPEVTFHTDISGIAKRISINGVDIGPVSHAEIKYPAGGLAVLTVTYHVGSVHTDRMDM
jgi:hypothetical protein